MLIPIRDLNPTRRAPVVTIAIIALNVFVFFSVAHGLAISDASAFRYGAIPCNIVGHCSPLPPPVEQLIASRSALVSIFTSMFMHADILHIGFNMLFLWVFGNNVEDRLGRIRFAMFYLACGVAAAFAHIAFNSNSVVPTIGASGAISGVLGAYIVLWPRATVISLVPLGFFFFSVRTRAWFSLGLWFVVQILGGLAGLGRAGADQGSGVAYLAHVGGFLAGVVLIFAFGGYRRGGSREVEGFYRPRLD